MQDKSKLQYDEDYEAYKAGKYRETAANWLSSSWQGDALQVSLDLAKQCITGQCQPVKASLQLHIWLALTPSLQAVVHERIF